MYVNFEVAQAARSDVREGLLTIIHQLRVDIQSNFGSSDPGLEFFAQPQQLATIAGNVLYSFLTFWAQRSSKPIVLFIDEIDSLVGDTLISVLRQLRAGYTNRPLLFPQAVCLVGVRDVRDYRIWSDVEQKSILGGSAFNIKAESLTLSNFSPEQVRDLYLQHTQETGQKFTDEAIEYAFYLTQGQPWLVNALAYQACFVDVKDQTQIITKEVIERAKETLIKRCDTHIDVLIDRLQEKRVYDIIDAIIGGQSDMKTYPTDDVQYVRDLGLIKLNSYEIANPIYQEVIPRALVQMTEERIQEKAVFYQNPDGSIDMHKLLEKFTDFYRENSTTWLEDFKYKESGPHLLIMAFMQRIINGNGTIHREYALDRKRVDLLIGWKEQRIVIELKVKRSPTTEADGLIQTAGYMDISNATEGHLVIFDPDKTLTWDTKIFYRQVSVGNKIINVWGM